MSALYDPVTRSLIAYGLLVLLGLAAAAVVWWNVHHSYRRVDARRRDRESRRHERVMAERGAAKALPPRDG